MKCHSSGCCLSSSLSLVRGRQQRAMSKPSLMMLMGPAGRAQGDKYAIHTLGRALLQFGVTKKGEQIRENLLLFREL